MKNSREEGVVYMQRPTRISSSNPLKRRRHGEASSVGWYNLEKTKAVKECYKCSEFDEFIPMEDLIKHGEKGNTISSSNLEFQIQEQDKHRHSSEEGTALVDVNLTVKGSYREENVPFVSLTSRFNGKAILGYPLEIRELGDRTENYLPGEESLAHKLFHEGGSRFRRLVWRTSRRTPVCYVTKSLLCSSAPKKQKLGKEAVSTTCVPVQLIFSKLLAALGVIQSEV